MIWLLVGLMIWVALALPAAVLIGKAIRLADARRTVSDGRAAVPRPRPALEDRPAARESSPV